MITASCRWRRGITASTRRRGRGASGRRSTTPTPCSISRWIPASCAGAARKPAKTDTSLSARLTFSAEATTRASGRLWTCRSWIRSARPAARVWRHARRGLSASKPRRPTPREPSRRHARTAAWAAASKRRLTPATGLSKSWTTRTTSRRWGCSASRGGSG